MPFILFIAAFAVHYFMVMDYQEKLYQFHPEEIRSNLLHSEIQIFKLNLVGNGLLLILLIIGATLVLNVGFLFFDLNFDVKDVFTVVVRSSIFISITYLLLPVILYTQTTVYTFEDLYNIEYDFSLAYFLQEFSPIWIRNLLESFSLSQVVFILFLISGISKTMRWSLKKTAVTVGRIYGVGFIMWNCFVALMDLNFSNY